MVYTIGADQTKTNEALIAPEDSAVLRAKPTATQYNSVIGVVARGSSVTCHIVLIGRSEEPAQGIRPLPPDAGKRQDLDPHLVRSSETGLSTTTSQRRRTARIGCIQSSKKSFATSNPTHTQLTLSGLPCGYLKPSNV